MTALQSLFYSAVLWCCRLELAIALAAPERNHRHIAALLRDIDDYERALIRLELSL